MMACSASPRKASRNGTAKMTAQKAETLGKWRCQKWGATRGKTAMESRMPRKGSALQSGRRVPRWTSPSSVSAVSAVPPPAAP